MIKVLCSISEAIATLFAKYSKKDEDDASGGETGEGGGWEAFS